MEDRLCGVHRNKMKDNFCWDCQSVLCAYCLEEHVMVRHKVFRLRSSALVGVALDGSQRPKEREAAKEPAGPAVQLPGTLFEPAPPPPKAPDKVPEEKKKPEPPPALCALCNGPEAPGQNMMMLQCAHSSHRDCLKQ